MDDTINRRAAIDSFPEDALAWDISDGYIAPHYVRKILETLPSAEQRKKGEWIRNDNGTYSCSVCQSWIPEEQRHYARYCLYCGAEMKGGQNE